ncbi:MAG: DUF4376 domain-containing protein [Deltaproteobacteria bacterium]|jgi:hypothetical protein|nr:DUF4376 domain-containing protein [Deltaproteobacteria bacterium]
MICYLSVRNNTIYIGDMQPGDREATPEEIRAHFGDPLDNARAAALPALREKRKAVEYGGFTFQSQRWDSAEKDELRLNSMLKMFELAGLTEFPGWKIAEGVYITATPEIIQGAAIALMQHYAAAFAVEAAKAVEINALTTAEAVQVWLATELDTGWSNG